MSLNLYESHFNVNIEETNSIPIAGLTYLSYLEKKKMLDVKKMSSDMFLLYDTFKKTSMSDYTTGLQSEKIKSYFGTKYCDDFDMYGDFKNKKPLQNLFKILNNKKNDHLDDSTKSSILHIFNELDRNVRNHSGFKDIDNSEYLYGMVIYPQKNQLHLTILDDGQGINKSLASNHTPVLSSVKEGISSHSNWLHTDEMGRNSGYGLYLCNELSKRKHCLEILDNGEYYTSYMADNDIGIGKINDSNFIDGITLINVIIDLDTINKDLENVQIKTKTKSSKSSLIHLDMNKLRKIISSKEYNIAK